MFMFMFMFMYYPYTSLVTTGHIHVQFTLKVVIITNLVYAYIIALASILNIYQITKSARHLSLHIKQTTFGVYKSCW